MIRCSRIDAPIERVNRLKRIKYTDAPFSGQAVLSAGLGFLVLWMDIRCEEQTVRSTAFRLVASAFMVVMVCVLLFNMVQAILTTPVVPSRRWVRQCFSLSFVDLEPVELPCSLRSAYSYAWIAVTCTTLASIFAPYPWRWILLIVLLVLFLALPPILVLWKIEDRCAKVTAILRNALLLIPQSLLWLIVCVTFLVASIVTFAAFVLRAVFDIFRRVRAFVFLQFDALYKKTLFFYFGMSGTLVVVAANPFVFVSFLLLTDVVYVLLIFVLFIVDGTLWLVGDLRLMPIMGAYGGSLAWSLGTESVEIVNKSMVDMIVEESDREGGVGGYEYLRGVQEYNLVPRVGQRAVVMVEDSVTKSLSCHIRGERRILPVVWIT